jgi:hypothetical protein
LQYRTIHAKLKSIDICYSVIHVHILKSLTPKSHKEKRKPLKGKEEGAGAGKKRSSDLSALFLG